MMRKIFFLLVLIPFTSVFAQSSQFSSESPSLNRKVRNLGMGNTGVALRGDPDSSPFYNPAGLNDLEKSRIQFFSITGDLSEKAVPLIKDVKDLVDNLNNAATPADKVNIYDQFLAAHSGQFNHLRFSLDLFNYVRKNFAAGLLIDEKLDLAVRDRALGQMDLRNFGDLAGYFAFSHDFYKKFAQFGVTLKPTARFAMDQVDQSVTLSDILGTDSNGKPLLKSQVEKIKDGHFEIGADVGLKSDLTSLNLPGFAFLKPAVGVTWQDIGNTSFGAAEGNPQTINVGAAIHPDFGIFKNAVALDFRDINVDKDFLTKVHFGVESQLDLPVNLALRAGLSQGYITGGVTVDLWAMKIDGAIYYEEVGINSKRDGSLRFAGSISFNI